MNLYEPFIIILWCPPRFHRGDYDV